MSDLVGNLEDHFLSGPSSFDNVVTVHETSSILCKSDCFVILRHSL